MLIHQGLLSCYSIGLARPQKSEYNKRKRAKREGTSPSRESCIYSHHKHCFSFTSSLFHPFSSSTKIIQVITTYSHGQFPKVSCINLFQNQHMESTLFLHKQKTTIPSASMRANLKMDIRISIYRSTPKQKTMLW